MFIVLPLIAKVPLCVYVAMVMRIAETICVTLAPLDILCRLLQMGQPKAAGRTREGELTEAISPGP